MIIRKLFKFEGAHIVRNCSSDRCKRSIHGHSYVVEVFLTAKGLDNGQMIVDFGLLKGTVRDFIDSFDHCYAMWDKEYLAFQEFILYDSDRFVKMPVSPSAEMFSLMFLYVIDRILENTEFKNAEFQPQVSSVRVHETDTGYAESFRDDLKWWDWTLKDIEFSQPIKDEWKDPLMWEKLMKRERFINPIIELTHNI